MNELIGNPTPESDDFVADGGLAVEPQDPIAAAQRSKIIVSPVSRELFARWFMYQDTLSGEASD